MGPFRKGNESRMDDETEALATAVTGAAIEVHRHLGPGLAESVYKLAFSHELDLRGIPHQCEAPVPICYKGKLAGEGKIDILAARVLILELKVVEQLSEVHRAQTIGYLQATKLNLALLINFNVAILRDGIKRVIRTD
jgi:GxxExxY protein